MPFSPISLLVLYDDARGYCGRVIPRMKEMLEQRAFIVDTHKISDGPIDIGAYKGIVIGSPSFGLGIKGGGPTDDLVRYVEENLPDLDEHKVAVFCVYELRTGMTLEKMKGMIIAKGADLVAAHGYHLFRLNRGEHLIPAECMVRIR